MSKKLVRAIAAVATIIGILATILTITGEWRDVDPHLVIDQLLMHFSDQESRSLVVYGIVVLPITIIAITIASAFLFQTEFSDNTIQSRRGKRFWWILKHFSIKERQIWHLIVGYFISILLLSSSAADNLLGISGNGTTQYGAYFAAMIAVSAMLVMSRLLSSLGFNIVGTNIGLFIVGIYLAEAILQVSLGRIPVTLFSLFQDTRTAPTGTIFYSEAFVLALIATGMDWFWIKLSLGRAL